MEEIIMNIENLKVGQSFKNYKELCLELGIEIKASANSKNAQLKELSRHVKYNKIGHKFTIEEIYETALKKEDNRGGSYNTIYGDIIQLLIADLLAQSDGHISIGRSKLMLTIGMVNVNYSDCRELVEKLSKYTEMDEKVIYDFYNTSASNFKYTIETALRNLMDKRVIMYNTIVKVKEIGKFTTRNATGHELEMIMDIEKNILDELGYDKLSSVRVSKDWKEFRLKSKRLLHEQSDIQYYYTAYDITVNSKYIYEECNDLVDLLLEKAKRLESKNELNQIVRTNIMNNAQKRHEKGFTAGKRMSKVRLADSYIGNFEKLTHLLINKNTPNILHEIRKVEIEEDIFPQELLDEIDKLFC
jgi:hypothetical protein